MVKKRSLKMQFSLTTLMAYSNETQVNHSLYIIPSEVTITISNWILFLQSYSIILVSHMPLYPPQEWGVGTGMPKRVRVWGIIYTTSN